MDKNNTKVILGVDMNSPGKISTQNLQIQEEIELDLSKLDEKQNKTLRQKFANWKKSNEGEYVLSEKLRKQLYTCPSCFCQINRSNLHVHHLFPISKMDSTNEELATKSSNLVLLCGKCNLRQGSQVDTRFD